MGGGTFFLCSGPLSLPQGALLLCLAAAWPCTEFPNVFGCSFITTELVSNYSLLFKVSGSDASLQPYLLMSHMDVVPAVSPEWTVDPFSGRMDDTYIWGRGAIDVKNTLVVRLSLSFSFVWFLLVPCYR